jgi:hypothetical protein
LHAAAEEILAPFYSGDLASSVVIPNIESTMFRLEPDVWNHHAVECPPILRFFLADFVSSP